MTATYAYFAFGNCLLLLRFSC